MCTCKKNARLRYLEGFFDYAGSSLPYEDVYSFLLTSLYQLDDNGNKVLVDSDNESGKFKIDIDKPLCVGALFDNTSNLYNDIVKYGFKTIDNYDAKESENSVIIDADEDSVLPISCNEDTGVCTFDNNIRLLSLPRVNFYIYTMYSGAGVLRPEFSGDYRILRMGYGKTGSYHYPTEFENTGAIDKYGNIIQRAKASVLMLPSDKSTSGDFRLYGYYRQDGRLRTSVIDNYSFDGSVGYGQEVDADGTYKLCHINFVNADINHADLVPTDSCQFVGRIQNKITVENRVSYINVPFGTIWGDELNDIYCNLSGYLYINYSQKDYNNNVSGYIDRVFLNGLYNTRFLSSNKSMYLYNVEHILGNISIEDNIDIRVKRLPVINLAGKVSKSDFDSSKPYIYIVRDDADVYSDYGLLLCKYADLDSDLILQATDYAGSGIYRKLTKQTSFTIYCSSSEPNESYLCDKNDGNATEVYKLVCQPTEMNEEVQYTLTKV